MLNAYDYIRDFKRKMIPKPARELISHVYVYVDNYKPYKVSVRFDYNQEKLFKRFGVKNRIEIFDVEPNCRIMLPERARPNEKYIIQYNQFTQDCDVFAGEGC